MSAHFDFHVLALHNLFFKRLDVYFYLFAVWRFSMSVEERKTLSYRTTEATDTSIQFSERVFMFLYLHGKIAE